MAPTISVIVCAHNEAQYLAACLHSLLAQSRLPDEILVINNASTDATRRRGGGDPARPRGGRAAQGAGGGTRNRTTDRDGRGARLPGRRLPGAADLARARRATIPARPRSHRLVRALSLLRLGLVGTAAHPGLRLHARAGHAAARQVHPAHRHDLLRRQLRRARRAHWRASAASTPRSSFTARTPTSADACLRSGASACSTIATSTPRHAATWRWGRARSFVCTSATSRPRSCITGRRTPRIST